MRSLYFFRGLIDVWPIEFPAQRHVADASVTSLTMRHLSCGIVPRSVEIRVLHADQFVSPSIEVIAFESIIKGFLIDQKVKQKRALPVDPVLVAQSIPNPKFL